MLSPRLVLLLLPVILEVVSSDLPGRLHSSHNHTERDQECYEDEYKHDGKCCRTCPAGYYVSVHCTENHPRGVCKACTPGESFTEAANGREDCLPCLICKDDKVMIQECTPKTNRICECKPGYYCSPGEPCEICNRCSRCGTNKRIKEPCTPTKDTVCEDIPAAQPTSTNTTVKDKDMVQECTPKTNQICECKPGYYCSPGEPCEICNRCSRCGTDQHIKEPCTPTKDTVCEDIFAPQPTSTNATVKEPKDPSDRPPGSTFDRYRTLAIVPSVFVFILIVICVYICYKCKAEKKPKKNISENSLVSVSIQGTDPEEDRLPPEHQQLMLPEEDREIDNLVNQQAVPYLGQPEAQSEPRENSIAEPLEGDVEDEESPQQGAPCNQCLMPAPCDTQWDTFIYIVIDHVPPNCFLQLVRELHLHKATTEQILKDYHDDSRERSYKLLSRWREQMGKQASMKAVVNKLKAMNLGGCCENIVNIVRTKKIPMN